METTDILKLKKPSQNDFYNVNDFNDNMDILEAEAAKAKARQATLLVHAPAGYSIEVVHQSCAYTAVSTAVGNDAYATIVLPFGGCATINFRQNTQTEDVKCTLVEDLIADGRTTHIILSDDLIAYQSPLSAIPAGTYAAGGPCAPGAAMSLHFVGSLIRLNEHPLMSSKPVTAKYLIRIRNWMPKMNCGMRCALE